MWLFQERLFTVVEQSQQCAVVLAQRGNWTSPNPGGTIRFPRLLTEIWADPDRVGRSDVDPLSAKDKILLAHEAIDVHLHNVDSEVLWWPTDPITGYRPADSVRVIKSSRAGELDFFPVPDGDGMMRATVFYNLGVA
jgi:hypothetical protein